MGNKGSLRVNDMLDRLRAFCSGQGLEVPVVRLIEVDGVLMPYAVPLHLVRDDQMGQYDMEVVFLLVDFPIGRIGRQRRVS